MRMEHAPAFGRKAFMSISRGIAAAVVVLSAAALGAGAARAEELWAVRSGLATFHFNVPLLRDLGLELVEVESTASPPEDLLMEEPNWTFAIRGASDLAFRTEHGIVLPEGPAGGVIRLAGAITVRERATGRESRLDGLEIAHVVSAQVEATRPLGLRSAAAGGLVFCELVDPMFDFEPAAAALEVHYLNARVAKSWADAIGRPELTGWFVGIGEVRATADLLESTAPATPAYEPNFRDGVLDVSLGKLGLIQEVGHEGTFPAGFAGLSMSTTACNIGTVDVPWRARMKEDHPLIHMALYRLSSGRFEQIGVSWLKHGFYALAHEDCMPCQGASSGTFLRAGCSDTYGVANNSERALLGPRPEVNAYTGTWSCTGSHFAGGEPDCQRRHGGTGHGPVEHRLAVADADLGNPAATYYYEAYYVVRGDENLSNNWGSRHCVTSWNGSVWAIGVPDTADDVNPLVHGPALTRWGEQATAAQNVTNIGFHDSDGDPTNDWPVTVENGTIAWQTEPYDQNPNANALGFGIMHNFRFDAYSPAGRPGDLNATLGLFKPGPGTEAAAATRGPLGATTAVAGPAVPVRTRLIGIRPNPADQSATVHFELARRAAVRMDVHDAAGRFVRTLIDGGRGPGAHAVVWDGRGEGRERVRPGVYYARLRSAGETAVKSVLFVD